MSERLGCNVPFEGELKLKPGSVALIYGTFFPKWYPGKLRSVGDTDKVRGDLTLKCMAKAEQRGYPSVVSDGGSTADFLERLRGFKSILLVIRKGIERGEGRRQGFKAASEITGVEVLLQNQGEKPSIVLDAPKIAFPIQKGDADIIVPRRNPALHKATYPEFQWKSEVSSNAKYNGLLHRTGLLPEDEYLDMFFGPFAFRNDPKILELFFEKYEFVLPATGIKKYVQPELWSDGYFFSIVKALHEGHKVSSVEVDFRYPKIQRKNEETTEKGAVDQFTKKRVAQKWGLLDELIHFIRLLRNDPKSGLRRIEGKCFLNC